MARILVAEDDDNVRAFVTRALAHMGHEVTEAEDGGIAADPSLGGELEFMDPRGSVPLMNAPHLRIAGNLSAGSTERIRPQAGRMVIFPAWVMHGVRPYRGGAERISIAFNLAV